MTFSFMLLLELLSAIYTQIPHFIHEITLLAELDCDNILNYIVFYMEQFIEVEGEIDEEDEEEEEEEGGEKVKTLCSGSVLGRLE